VSFQGGSHQALDLHWNKGGQTLGHLVQRAAGCPQGFQQLRSGALGLWHSRCGEDPHLHAGVALLHVQVGNNTHFRIFLSANNTKYPWLAIWSRNTRIIILSPSLRYIPVGLLERVPQKINERPPYYLGRNYLESLMASQHVGDWIRIRWAGNTSAFKTKLHRITATLMYLLIIISFFSPLQWNAPWTSTKEFHLLAQTQSQCLQMIFSFSQHPGFLMSLFLFDVENII